MGTKYIFHEETGPLFLGTSGPGTCSIKIQTSPNYPYLLDQVNGLDTLGTDRKRCEENMH